MPPAPHNKPETKFDFKKNQAFKLYKQNANINICFVTIQAICILVRCGRKGKCAEQRLRTFSVRMSCILYFVFFVVVQTVDTVLAVAVATSSFFPSISLLLFSHSAVQSLLPCVDCLLHHGFDVSRHGLASMCLTGLRLRPQSAFAPRPSRALQDRHKTQCTRSDLEPMKEAEGP